MAHKRGELTANLSCRAHPQDMRALAALAHKRGQSKSAVVRDLIQKAYQAGGGQQDGQRG